MKNRKPMITAILLLLAIGTYTRLIANGGVRTVEFLSIFAIGLLTGVLLVQFFGKASNTKS